MAKRPQENSTGKAAGKTPRKTAARTKTASKAAPHHPEGLRDAVIEAAMMLAARDGWRRLSMADIAAEAGLSLAEVLVPFPTKYDVMNAFQDRIDAAMLTDADALAVGGDDGADARDRLFDLLMARFDALAPYRRAMAEIARDSLGDPGALRFLPRMARTMSRILEAAGIGAGGLVGLVRAKGVALIYADAFRVWLGDDTPDQSKTMAALDRGLRRAEKAEGLLCRLRTRRIPGNATPGDTPATAETPG